MQLIFAICEKFAMITTNDNYCYLILNNKSDFNTSHTNYHFALMEIDNDINQVLISKFKPKVARENTRNPPTEGKSP